MKKKTVYLLSATLLCHTLLPIHSVSAAEQNHPAPVVQKEVEKEKDFLTMEMSAPTSSFSMHSVDPEDQKVIQIRDKNLENYLKERFELHENEPITDKHMESLITLDVSNQGIADLSGMEYAKNIEDIRFNQNMVSDLSPLNGLTKLTTIGANTNRITTLTSLTHMPVLEQLSINENRLTSLRGIEALPSIQNLWISRNQITSLAELYTTNNLRMFEFNSCQITDLSPLINHTRLEEMYGAENRIRRIDEHLDFPNLRLLELGANDFESQINANQLQIMNKIAEFERLDTLALSFNGISTIEPLAKLTNLERLFFMRNNISSIETLGSLPKLRSVNATNQLTSQTDTVVNTPTPLLIRDQNGQIPDIEFFHPGSYDGQAVTWHDVGTNNLGWSTDPSSPIQFSGLFIQYAAPDYRPSEPTNVQYVFNPRSTTFTWDPPVDVGSGISHYEFYLWDILIDTPTKPELTTDQVRSHGIYPVKIVAVSYNGRKSAPWQDLIYRPYMPVN